VLKPVTVLGIFMRTELQPFNGKIVSGRGLIAEIGQKFVVLRKVRIKNADECDHCWVQNSKFINIREGEWIRFKARIIRYRKRPRSSPKSKKGEFDYGLEILEWQETHLEKAD
jgi:hypothetical protein